MSKEMDWDKFVSTQEIREYERKCRESIRQREQMKLELAELEKRGKDMFYDVEHEMLETGTLPRKQECTADLSYHFSTEKYRRYLLKGAVKLFHSILHIDDTVFLSAFPYDVLVGCQQGEMIRECERYVAAGATIPLKAYGKRPLYVFPSKLHHL